MRTLKTPPEATTILLSSKSIKTQASTVFGRVASWSTSILLLLIAFSTAESAAEDSRQLLGATDSGFTLADRAITESSGLAASRRVRDRFWTHNDSGDGPRLYAFDSSGRRTGECQVPHATSIDWEDMAAFFDDDKPRLAVADCGDNSAMRDSIAIYFFDEPDPDRVTKIDHFTRLNIRFADGPRDCEAMGIDVSRRQIVLLSKSALPLAGLYLAPLPERQAGLEITSDITVTRVMTLAMPMITAMDIDETRGDVWIGNYFSLFCFRCLDRRQSIAEQLSSLPENHSMPKLKQIEALGVDSSHRVWVTTEGTPTRMVQVATDARP